MKKNILFFMLMLVGLACSDSDDEGIIPGKGGSMSAKCKSEGINWATFDPKYSSTTMKVSYYSGSSRVLISMEFGEAGKSNGRRVFLSVGFAYAGKGKYKISPLPADDSVLYSYYGIDRLGVMEGGTGNGEVEITEHVANEYIAGKFHFDIEKNGKKSKVEDGEFKLKVDF